MKELQVILTIQIDFVKKIPGPADILPLKETFLVSLGIHMLDAEAQLKQVRRLPDTLSTPHELAKVEGHHLVQKQLVLNLIFGALGTYMVTLTDKK